MAHVTRAPAVSSWLMLLGALACSSETGTATNAPDPGTQDGGGGMSGGAGASGAAGLGNCTPGQVVDIGTCEMCGTARRTCDQNGAYGPPECVNQGECESGDSDMQACGCGMQSRTCKADCTWDDWGACSGGGGCTPGQTDGTGCDACSEKVCGNDCQWSACQLKAGSECEWQMGNNPRCCNGTGKQWCLSNCKWSDQCCTTCGTCS